MSREISTGVPSALFRREISEWGSVLEKSRSSLRASLRTRPNAARQSRSPANACSVIAVLNAKKCCATMPASLGPLVSRKSSCGIASWMTPALSMLCALLAMLDGEGKRQLAGFSCDLGGIFAFS